MKKQRLIIPIDFTNSTENALIYAKNMASNSNDDLVLFHVLDELSESEAMAKLDALVNKHLNDFSGSVELKTADGKVSEQIGNVAELVEANFIVMGVHETTRFGSLFGSDAISVISKSKVPFIVVQDGTVYTPVGKIAMTIDLERESIQIVKAASKLCEALNSELVLVAGDHSDPELKRKVTNNLRVSLEHLKQNNIKASVHYLERKQFIENFVTYCKEENIEMIAATYYTTTFQFLSAKFVQNLLSNSLKIPVLALDAEAVSSGSQFSFLSV